MKLYKKIAKKYNVVPKALKRKMVQDGVKPDTKNRLEILEVLFVYAPDLFYTREDEFENSVDYLDINTPLLLIKDIESSK